MTTVAIHQPNFFPWLGYFDKIAKSDVFIFLDDTQFQKTGGVWTNRVKLLISGEARWITAPVGRNFPGAKAICDMQFQQANPWREKMLRSIELNYSKAPYFKEMMALLTPLILNQSSCVSTFNINAIKTISSTLGLHSTDFMMSSKMQHNGAATELLVSLTKSANGTAYLCGGGAGGYQDDDLFLANNIELQYQNFRVKEYKQSGHVEFIGGLSIIDALMWCGLNGVSEMLMNQK